MGGADSLRVPQWRGPFPRRCGRAPRRRRVRCATGSGQHCGRHPPSYGANCGAARATASVSNLTCTSVQRRRLTRKPRWPSLRTKQSVGCSANRVSTAASCVKGHVRRRPRLAMFPTSSAVTNSAALRKYATSAPDGNLGVQLGTGDAGVAQHLLDEADVGAALEHERGHGVGRGPGRDVARARAGVGVSAPAPGHGEPEGVVLQATRTWDAEPGVSPGRHVQGCTLAAAVAAACRRRAASSRPGPGAAR